MFELSRRRATSSCSLVSFGLWPIFLPASIVRCQPSLGHRSTDSRSAGARTGPRCIACISVPLFLDPEKALQVLSLGLQGIDPAGGQAVEDVQVGARGANAGREREVAGEVGEAKLEDGDQRGRGADFTGTPTWPPPERERERERERVPPSERGWVAELVRLRGRGQRWLHSSPRERLILRLR